MAVRPYLLALAGLAFAAFAPATEIHYNQVGYTPGQPKPFYVSASDATSFSILDDANDAVVLSGGLSAPYAYADAGLTLRSGDFSDITTPGRYRIELSDGTVSAPFEIGDAVFRAPLEAALKGFYFNRASTALAAEHAGVYARPLGHPDTNVAFHSSTGRAGDPNAASPKGWYDAGDFGKYVVNGGFALANLLAVHELYPGAIGDDLGIPESGNGVSDLLDECRWQLEWFLTMQDVDGGVFHKLTTSNFVGYVMPHQSTGQRYFIGKSTTATLNFAAALAHAARLYEPFDANFAATCLAAAEDAYAWALNHPNELFTNPPGIFTGEYGDRNTSDEFDWAAAQLFITTGAETYRARTLAAASSALVDVSAGWPATRNLGLYSLATVPNDLPAETLQALRAVLVGRAEQTLADAANSPIGVPMTASDFFWGSNGHAAGKGVLLAHAHHLTGDPTLLLGMAAIADYLLGRNATGYSFLTGYGARPPMFIHHRASLGDGIAAPVPGLLAGGPNSGRQDSVVYPHTEPARSYVDHADSYASNEVAINWNAPLVHLLAALHESRHELTSGSVTRDDAYRLAAHPQVHTVDSASGLLANDANLPGSPADLTVEVVTPPALGTLELLDGGAFRYTPPADYLGALYFTYQLRSGTSTSNPATVTLTLYPVDPSPPGAILDDAAVWLDASAIDRDAPAEYDPASERVRLWKDLSGNLHDAANTTTATQPTLVLDALHGRPMVRFGNDAFLEIGDIRAEAGGLTAFIVSRSASTGGDGFQRMLSGYTGSGNNWESPNFFVTRPRIENGVPQAYDGAITTQSNNDRALQNLLVGVQTGNVNDFDGLIGELILFDRALNASEIAVVEAYLADKWQVWSSLPASHPQRSPDPYDAWLWNYPELVDRLPTDDPNQNGLSNFLEYLMGFDPGSPDPAPALPLALTWANGGPVFQIEMWSDFAQRGLVLGSNRSLDPDDWSLPGESGHEAFELIDTQPTDRAGISELHFAPTAPVLDQPLFLRVQAAP